MPLWQIVMIHLGPPVIVAIPALLAWIHSRNNSKAIADIHVTINSRMDALLKASKLASFAEGQADERNK